jgi:outer membrane protein assembly factor BamB
MLRRGLIAAGVLAVLIAGAAAFVLLHAPGNVSHPNVSFTTTSTTTTTTVPPKKKAVVNNFEWPRYGFDGGRTRLFAGPSDLRPPFRRGWTHEDYSLLEFPPVIFRNTMYFMNDAGWVKSISTQTGHVFWQKHVGTLAAASPALGLHEQLVIVPVLSTHGSSPGSGRIVALSMRNGRVVWSHDLAAGSESSPIVWDRTLYFGDQGGTVYSMNARTGHVNWTYHATGAVKGGPAYSDGKVYFGDYGGHAYCLNASTGKQVWADSTSGTAFGFGSGNFYATPAVAFGRVYLGNTDGRVYSFAADTGRLAWATGTGAYVYASAAVENVPGLGPTVYLGSYDGNFYAFDARSGAVRWSHPAGGKISGSATIVGNVVYYADLGSKTTAGLDLRTGRQVFSFGDGAFTPVIADDSAVFLVGEHRLYELLPQPQKRRPKPHPKPAAKAHHAAKRPAKHAPARKPPAHRKPARKPQPSSD